MSEVDSGTAYVIASIVTALGVVVTAIISARAGRNASAARNVAEETRHQVTANHHESDSPTLPDRLDDLESAVTQLVRHVMNLKDQHAEDTAALWAALGRLEPPGLLPGLLRGRRRDRRP